MKIASTIAKILTAIAAIAGIAYVLATYGDKIVEAAKKLLGMTSKESEDTAPEAETVEAPAEATEEVTEEVTEEAPAEEATEEAPKTEEAPGEIVADETDFES